MLVLDCRAFGGQAGASARIENYLGFPTGISGMALMARAYNQAQKFGVEMAIPDEVAASRSATGRRDRFALAAGQRRDASGRARSCIASGARYRRLDVDNLDDFEALERALLGLAARGRLCAGQEVALVGAGNSAGPGRRLSGEPGRARSGCWCAARASRRSMSRYLVDRISRPCQRRGGDADAEVTASRRAATACCEADPLADGNGGEDDAGRSAICSCSSAPSRTPTGCRIPASRSTPRASS